MNKRLDRRERTLRKCLQRYRTQRRLWFNPFEPHRNHKRNTVFCNCRKRKRGCPKRGGGSCYCAGRAMRPAVRDRIDGKKACQEAVRELGRPGGDHLGWDPGSHRKHPYC